MPHSRPRRTRQSAVAAKSCCACHAMLCQGLLEQMAQPDAAPAALVLMQAARVSPERTRHAAEPTAGPKAAATSADTDENGRVCVGDLGPYAPLLTLTSEHQRLAAMHHLHAMSSSVFDRAALRSSVLSTKRASRVRVASGDGPRATCSRSGSYRRQLHRRQAHCGRHGRCIR